MTYLAYRQQAATASFSMSFDKVLFDHPSGRIRLYGQGSVGVDMGVKVNIKAGQDWSARAVPTLQGNFSTTLESTVSAWIRTSAPAARTGS